MKPLIQTITGFFNQATWLHLWFNLIQLQSSPAIYWLWNIQKCTEWESYWKLLAAIRNTISFRIVIGCMCHSVPMENFISFPFMFIVKKSQSRDIIHEVSSAHTVMKSKMTAIKPAWCCKSPSAHCMNSQPPKSFLDTRCSRGWIWRRTSYTRNLLFKEMKQNEQTNKQN